MVYTKLKITLQKSQPKQLIYRDFKNFYFQSFKNELPENMFTCVRSYNEFDKKTLLQYLLNKHALIKKKWLRGNQELHMKKTVNHEVRKRSKLKNKAIKTTNPSNIENNNK